MDLEALELGARSGLHRAGGSLLVELLRQHDAPPTSPCRCGQQARYYDRRERDVLTVLGTVRFERAYYVCPECGEGHCPRDRELGLEGQSCSPGVRRMLATVGSETSFEKGREPLQLLAGLEVTAKAIERQAEAIGADSWRSSLCAVFPAFEGFRVLPACLWNRGAIESCSYVPR